MSDDPITRAVEISLSGQNHRTTIVRRAENGVKICVTENGVTTERVRVADKIHLVIRKSPQFVIEVPEMVEKVILYNFTGDTSFLNQFVNMQMLDFIDPKGPEVAIDVSNCHRLRTVGLFTIQKHTLRVANATALPTLSISGGWPEIALENVQVTGLHLSRWNNEEAVCRVTLKNCGVDHFFTDYSQVDIDAGSDSHVKTIVGTGEKDTDIRYQTPTEQVELALHGYQPHHIRGPKWVPRKRAREEMSSDDIVADIRSEVSAQLERTKNLIAAFFQADARYGGRHPCSVM